MINDFLIKTPKGLGKVDKIYVSELGFLMIKIAFEDGTFTGYNLGKHNPEDNFFTKEIFKDRLVGSIND
jgi:hypothetical protein